MACDAVSWDQGCGAESMLGYAYADRKTDACDRMQSVRSPPGLPNPNNTKLQQGVIPSRRVR